MKVHGIPRRFSGSKTFGFYKILSRIILLMDKIFRFTSISQILTFSCDNEAKVLMTFWSQFYKKIHVIEPPINYLVSMHLGLVS